MDTYDFLNIPDSCFIGNTIYKKLFYENADLSTRDKSLFTDTVSKITWLYCLKPETINITAYKDEVRDYLEIEVIEVLVYKDYKLKRIAEIIMRTIPYPMLLIFKLEDKRQFYVAHQRINQIHIPSMITVNGFFLYWQGQKSYANRLIRCEGTGI